MITAEQRAAYVHPDANWSLIPEHMHGGVYRYVMHGVEPGDFLCALLENDFMEATGRADDANLYALAGWARFMFNYLPGGSFRSKANRMAWQERRGTTGRGV